MEYLVKNITTIDHGFIAHGVNCQGAMGSGVAKALKDKWPAIYVAYLNQPTGHQMLGKITVNQVEDAIWVVNCYTQEYYGPGDQKYASPDAIRTALNLTYGWASGANEPLYLPKIGAGLGGLDWETEVLPIVDELDTQWSSVDTYICVIDEAEIP